MIESMKGRQGAGVFVVTLPVLGVETTFLTSSPQVRDLLLAEYGHWARLTAASGVLSPSAGEVHIAVVDGAGELPSWSEVELTVSAPSVLEVAGGGVQGSVDTRDRRATVQVAQRALGGGLVRAAIEPLVLFLVSAQDRVPVHAACVIRGDVGIVLAGRSGAGKSTLVFAATRSGYAPLADDPVYVQVDPVLRVWGRRSEVNLRPEAVDHFPELAGLEPTRLPSGKTKLIVDPRGGRRHVERVGLCVLRRDGRREPGLQRISAEEAVDALTDRLESGFDLFRDVLPDRIQRLAARGAWRLDVGVSPLDAMPLLERIAVSLESSD